MATQAEGAPRVGASRKEHSVTRHTVFGTGQVGRLVARRLVGLGHNVTAVNRSGWASIPGAKIIAGDATDPLFTTEAAAKADVVYFCLNVADSGQWAQEFPPLQSTVLAAAQAAGARLVVLDNLCAYGPTEGQDLVETLPARPSSAKAAVRATMTAELLAAHAAGRVEVAIGRASDYFGPTATRSALGSNVFAAALAGRPAQVTGDPALPHSYSYTPDVAAALITLGTEPGATGEVWHLPVAETRTTQQIIDHVYRLAGQPPRTSASGRTGLRLAGLIKPAMRAQRDTLYQFTQPWTVDDSKFRSAFGGQVTPLDDALATTLRWYKDKAETGK
jgi:nucleoside-diphosphate-sugar epimerase